MRRTEHLAVHGKLAPLKSSCLCDVVLCVCLVRRSITTGGEIYGIFKVQFHSSKISVHFIFFNFDSSTDFNTYILPLS